MKKRSILTLALCMFFATLSSVSANNWKNKFIKGDGEIISLDHKVELFSSIQVASNVDVSVIEGTELSLVMTGHVNHIAFIKTTVVNGKLLFSWKDKRPQVPFEENVKVVITLPSELVAIHAGSQGGITVEKKIRAAKFDIHCSTQGDIIMHDLQTGILAVNISHQGDVTLKGSVDDMTVRISGQGDGEFYNLKAKNADCTVSGQGDCDINVTDNLKANASGQADITYSGNPKKIERNVSGQADVKQR